MTGSLCDNLLNTTGALNEKAVMLLAVQRENVKKSVMLAWGW